MRIIRQLAKAAKNKFLNTRGYHTSTPYLVIESDDWGSIRMPSKETLDCLAASGDCAAEDAFLSYDTLERAEDLLKLFECLQTVTDKTGKHPCMTANYAVANPKFESIDALSNTYAYEPFWETYDKYYGKENGILNAAKAGMEMGVFCPQLHAREHLNVNRWMRDLQKEKKDTVKAFQHNMVGVGASFAKENRFGYMDALNYDSEEELPWLDTYLQEAFQLFQKAFGYASKTYVASCYVWTAKIEKLLMKHHVLGMQTQCWQKTFRGNGTTSERRVFHYSGQKSKYGMLYSIRNCDYEPSLDGFTVETEEKCIRQIEEAFHNQKPAVINTHRLNYVGGIEEDHAEAARNGLMHILAAVVQRYPNVEFLSTPELVEKMRQEEKH